MGSRLGRGTVALCGNFSSIQSKSWLSAIVCCSMANINDILDGSMDKRKVRGLVSCCGQDGYRVLQLPIDAYTYTSNIYQSINGLQ